MYSNQNLPQQPQDPGFPHQNMQQDVYYGVSNPYEQNGQQYNPSYNQSPPLPNGYQQEPVTYAPPPVEQYNYDPNKIEYTNMTVDGWSKVQDDQTTYSHYWSGADAFQPQTVSESMHEEKKYNDVGCCVAFWINFLISIALFIWLVYESTQNHFKEDSDGQEQLIDLDWNYIGKLIGWSVLVAVGVNLIHAVYAIFAPKFYIKFGLVIGFILSVIMSIFAIIYCSILFVIFPILTLLVTICFYCSMCSYIKFSTVVFKMSTKLLIKHPSLMFFTFCQMIASVIISGIFSLMFLLISELGYSYFIYIYLILSYLWISITTGYVGYLVGAGVAATWYFLTDTDYYPKHPVWESFKRAMTTSFGSAAAAGLLLTIVQFLRNLAQSYMRQTDSCCIMCLMCIITCIIQCIEYIIRWMNKYGLIYCAIFGVPYTEGCRRYMELSCKKFCDVIMRSCIISNAISYNLIVFVAGAAVLGYAVGYWVYDDTLSEIYICSLTCIFAFIIFDLIAGPLEVIPDSILVCFVEDPSRLKTTAYELYEVINEQYDERLAAVING